MFRFVQEFKYTRMDVTACLPNTINVALPG